MGVVVLALGHCIEDIRMVGMSFSHNAVEPNLGPQTAIVLGFIAVIISINMIIVLYFVPKIVCTIIYIQPG